MFGFIKHISRIGPIGLILLLAVLLRLWGIDHGLPHIYSVDEPALVRSVMGLRFDLNPHHFDWPHFHFYFCYFFFVVLVKFRALLQVLNLRPLLEPLVPIFWQDPQIFYLEMRIISALMGTATVGLVYLIGRKLFDKKVGLLAAAFLAVYPLHNEISHYALLEAPLTFWVTLSFLFSVLIFKRRSLPAGRQGWRDYLLAGLFAGLAASTKYNGALAIVPITAGHILGSHKNSNSGVSKYGPFGQVLDNLWMLLLSGLVALGGFLLGTPFAVLDWKLFLSHEPQRGFLWQMMRVGAVSWSELPRVLWERLGVLISGSGVVIAVLGVWGLFVVLKNRRREGLLLLSFPLVYFFYIARLGYFNAHYFVPLAPFLSILAAAGLVWVLGDLRWAGLVLLVLVIPFVGSARIGYILSQKDTRQVASDWVAENIPEGSRIAKDGEYQPVLEGFEPIPVKDWSLDWFRENNVDYIIVAGYDLDEEKFSGLKLVKKVEPRLQPGPTILIYEVAR